MKSLSAVASGIQESRTLGMTALANSLRERGLDVVSFAAGEPDFATPAHIKQAGIRAIEEDFTKYTSASGTQELRRAVCERILKDCGVSYTPEQVLISSGAKHNIFIALAALLDPGDEVILPAPYWVSYREQVKMFGGVPVDVVTKETEGFKLRPEALREAVSNRTKCIILNNPCNPTGVLYTREELAAIAEVCREADIYVISDEIYYSLVYDGLDFVSFAALGEDAYERTILINGVSKSYAMTGWRIGYTLASKPLIAAMYNYQSNSTGSCSAVSQYAAAHALSSPQDETERMRAEFERRRDRIVEGINSVPGVSCVKPEGSFYVMMSIKELIGREIRGHRIENGDDFARVFLEEGLVATVPGSSFGTPDYVRWAYAVSMEEIDKGIQRLRALLEEG